MFTRANIAGFLQGLFVLPLCALFGGLMALLFHAHGISALLWIALCAFFPFAGAVKTRQFALLLGLVAGVLVSILIYLGARPHP
jgi:4-amino-4-deoxy-L-arabinose transferase-like glycosyltransferase